MNDTPEGMLVMGLILAALDLVVLLTSTITWTSGRISKKTHCVGLCVASSLGLVSAILCRSEIAILLQTVALTGSLWLWWNSGGGDNTKRHLKNLLKKFAPTRRTAPVTS